MRLAATTQDTAHLPRMRKAAPAAPSAPAGAPSTAPAAAASTTTSGSGGAGGGGADGAGRPTVVPPPRRRGAGAGRRVAGGLGAQDPLALFEQPGAEEVRLCGCARATAFQLCRTAAVVRFPDLCPQLPQPDAANQVIFCQFAARYRKHTRIRYVSLNLCHL